MLYANMLTISHNPEVTYGRPRHSDVPFLLDPTAQSKVRQGVAAELAGNCGASPCRLPGVEGAGSCKAALVSLPVGKDVTAGRAVIG
jgi:hypothetical protein